MPKGREAEDALGKKFYKARKAEVEKRVKPKRYKHILGVADTAEMLARTYGVDVDKARLAGLLHDWDKGMRDGEIRQRAVDLGIVEEVGPWVVEAMPEVLHGPTAAAALGREFPEIPDDVLHAIKCHTTGALEMSDLDKVLYVADAIEPGRQFQEADDLRKLVGQVDLDELFYQVYKFWTFALIRNDVVLHPDTIEIWNSIAKGKSKARKERYA